MKVETYNKLKKQDNLYAFHAETVRQVKKMEMLCKAYPESFQWVSGNEKGGIYAVSKKWVEKNRGEIVADYAD